ncbi:hypothetical protein [Pseudomonas soli]|uniref:hypothetical protein n=1 Tax=Pseudomonas soli TaxID=1306993 RepID=UPI0011602770|nr:hypothetical protein [Pseudomonas soli]
MSSIDTFVLGIQRANERKQKARAATTLKPDKPEHTQPPTKQNDAVSTPVLDDERYRIDLIKKIITYIRKKREEQRK